MRSQGFMGKSDAIKEIELFDTVQWRIDVIGLFKTEQTRMYQLLFKWDIVKIVKITSDK